jgi:uncharacterized protein
MSTTEGPLTLQRLPLFPLQTVLFPGGVLPLRIFEVRYLDMVQRCHKAGAPFGVVMLTQGSEVAKAPQVGKAGPTAVADELFHDVGTLAHIQQLDTAQAGLLHVVCKGSQRFRTLAREKLKHGLWVADVELLPADVPTLVPNDLGDTAHALQQVLESLQAQASAGQVLPMEPPHQWDDAGWVANRWCDLLPVAAELKQRLMSLDNPLVRLELVSDLLDKLRIDSGR